MSRTVGTSGTTSTIISQGKRRALFARLPYFVATTVVAIVLTAGGLDDDDSGSRGLIIAVAILCRLLIWVHDHIINLDSPRTIEHLPAVPGWPVVGNLLQLGCTHAFTYVRWGKVYGPVFQIRLGCKRLVVANSYHSAKELWVDNMTANASRPLSYTFHKVVSSTQGLTIGTTPWGDSYKRKRKVAGAALNKPAIRSYLGIIDAESSYCIRLMTQSYLGATADECEMEIHSFFRTYALNTSLSLNYGTRLDEIQQSTIQEIINVEKQVSRFRSTVHSYQDYLPFLRVFGNSLAQETRARRDRYMDMLLNKLKQEIATNTDRSCITGRILKDPNNAKVTEDELKSICLTMVSAGLDTVPAMLIYFIGHMSQPGYGQEIQQAAHREIRTAYPDDPWNDCLDDNRMNVYIKALVHETLRFGAMPISLPRETIREIHYQGATIPPGTILTLNTFAANFDSARYSEPYRFDPTRFIDPDGAKFISQPGPLHFAFGAGSRMCAGASLVERELYTAVVRLITAFQFLPPASPHDRMPTDPFVIFKGQNSLAVDPPKFKVRIVPRDLPQLQSWLGG
ncbi:hypothetical protein TRICI_001555 [Trichomonascus ciferrii]|uniref:Phenylacetate 2-hydroxylase n=1 Tax=Trichomonascus ciferrii TaxID=44093 RepID=A0A642V927_9ASCO|nr:hypothetical protein TRICI_001555 [Trichomonascus ciferrii]